MMKKGKGRAHHEICCLFSPETYLISLELVSLTTKYIVPDLRQVFDNKSKTIIFQSLTEHIKKQALENAQKHNGIGLKLTTLSSLTALCI